MCAMLTADYQLEIQMLESTSTRAINLEALVTYARPTSSAARVRKQVLQEMYEAHVEQIYKFVYGKVGNREDAEDITSQVFVKAAACLDIAQAERARLAWLFQAARTTTADYWRQFYSKATSSLEGLEEASQIEFASEPVHLCGSQEERPDQTIGKIESILATLPENHRRVLQLRFLQGRSLKEVAQVMGISENNARVLQHRALQRAARVGVQLGVGEQGLRSDERRRTNGERLVA